MNPLRAAYRTTTRATAPTLERPQFDAFDRELKLAAKLKQAGAFNGDTDFRLRRERCRAFIVDGGLQDEPSGFGQSYREYFVKTYGESL